MRVFLRAGIVLGVTVALAACGKDSAAPADFDNPGGVSSKLSSIDSTFDSDVYRSFGVATVMLDVATAPAIRPAATVLSTLRPKLERTGAQVFLPGLVQARKLQALTPQLSVSAAQGAIIPDSLYGRIYEWNDTTDQYVYRGNTVPNLNGVRFLLYAIGLDGTVFEPVTQIGTFDIIDQSTSNSLRLHVLVRNTAGTTTYLDYTIDLISSQSSAQATASGEVTNGLAAGANKTLSFDQTLTVTASNVRALATFALNNPAITVMLNESLTFTDPDLIINGDFRLIEPAQTIRVVGRVTVNTQSQAVAVNVTVYVNGHPVASLNGDPTVAQWVDAGGEPLSFEDLDALDHLLDAFESFDQAVSGLFTPIGTFAGL